jgi:hypothetical protein
MNRIEDQMDDAIPGFDVSDEALERAGIGEETAANPTVPSAIICIRFVQTKQQ